MNKPAKGIKGFLLYSPVSNSHFFRVYNPDKTFTDYSLAAEDIQIEILSDDLTLYEYENYHGTGLLSKSKLDWAEHVLHPQPGQKVVKVTYSPTGERITQQGHYNEKLDFIPD